MQDGLKKAVLILCLKTVLFVAYSHFSLVLYDFLFLHSADFRKKLLISDKKISVFLKIPLDENVFI